MSSYLYALQHDEYNIKSHCIIYYILYITQIDYHIDSTLLHLEQPFWQKFWCTAFRSRSKVDVKNSQENDRRPLYTTKIYFNLVPDLIFKLHNYKLTRLF